MLTEAKATHKATTASAQRALQVGHFLSAVWRHFCVLQAEARTSTPFSSPRSCLTIMSTRSVAARSYRQAWLGTDAP